MVFLKCVTFSDFITAKCDKGVFEDGCWILIYFIELHMVLHIVLTFSSKTGQWSIVTPVTQWDLVQAEPKLRDKWPNCQVDTAHCTLQCAAHFCCSVLHKLCCHLRWHKQLSLNRENVKTENKSPPLSCLHNPQICLQTGNKLESVLGLQNYYWRISL